MYRKFIRREIDADRDEILDVCALTYSDFLIHYEQETSGPGIERMEQRWNAREKIPEMLGISGDGLLLTYFYNVPSGELNYDKCSWKKSKG